ncbi:MAG: class I SAM-dependent methyltransferase [Desulfurococcales archaeon]|nr:class I SAM-dependent methyltransferase [Desulfurococcales archaeon]
MGRGVDIDYFYPDVDDRLTSKLVETFGDSWYVEELNVRHLVTNTVKELGLSVESSIDVGCGTGRLVPWVLKEFSPTRSVCLEPDPARLTLATRACHGHYCLPLQGSGTGIPLRDEVVDLVVWSHVIQHIPTYYLDRMFREVHRVMKPGGLVFLMTTHSAGEEYFLLVYDGGDRQEARRVDRETYNRYAAGPVEGYLPVRKFDLRWLESFIEQEGFRIVLKKFYHKLNDCQEEGMEEPGCYLDVAYLLQKGR